MNNLDFGSPYSLFALIIIPALSVHYYLKHSQKRPKIVFPFADSLPKIGIKKNPVFIHLPFVLRLATYTLLIIALARPRLGVSEREVITEGIDIVIALDVSGSMLAEDFRPNRLGAARKVAENFILGRKSDRIGYVIFAGQAFTQAPLTLDYNILNESLNNTRSAEREWDGTAIGMGLATAVNRVKETKNKNKIIILLTDGENNAGKIDPKTAADLAAEFKIRVYTIGVGSRGLARIPVTDQRTGRKQYVQQRVSIDENLLKEISENTGGKYYRATDNNSLKNIFNAINKLEKNRIEVKEYTNFTERFNRFLLPAFFLLILEIILRRTRLRRIP